MELYQGVVLLVVSVYYLRLIRCLLICQIFSVCQVDCWGGCLYSEEIKGCKVMERWICLFYSTSAIYAPMKLLNEYWRFQSRRKFQFYLVIYRIGRGR